MARDTPPGSLANGGNDAGPVRAGARASAKQDATRAAHDLDVRVSRPCVPSHRPRTARRRAVGLPHQANGTDASDWKAAKASRSLASFILCNMGGQQSQHTLAELLLRSCTHKGRNT